MLHGANLSPAFGLELMETVVGTHIDTVSKHQEQIYILRTRLMPLLIKILSEKASFNLAVRGVRLLRLLIRKWLHAMTTEIEVAMSVVNHLLDSNTSTSWKRVLCLELLKDIHDDPTLVRNIYAHYDEKEGRKNLIGDQLAAFVRLAAEKPAFIALYQSSSEIGSQQDSSIEPIAVDLGGFAGTVGTSTSETSLNKPGISSQWSTIRVPCIDQVDKIEPPALPMTYIYSLALACINAFSEGLAKFLLPFTVPSDLKSKRKQRALTNRQGQPSSTADENGEPSRHVEKAYGPAQSLGRERSLPINPLTLEGHEMYDQIRTSAHVVENCWPALLATSSTFFDAALDAEYYHALVRAFQKFTQIAGLLNLATPRDAFLTTLAKHAVPTATSRLINTPVSRTFKERKTDDEDRDDSDRDASLAARTSTERPKHSNRSLAPVTTRNLLCLRALLNLGTALGPVLHTSWTIILETLHHVDAALVDSEWQNVKGRWQISQGLADRTYEKLPSRADELNEEMSAVETAVTRLYGSTSDLPDQVFLQVLQCLRSLLCHRSGLTHDNTNKSKAETPETPTPAVSISKHRRLGSTAGPPMSNAEDAESSMLLLDRIGQIAQCNVPRLALTQPSESGWSIIADLFTDHLSSSAVTAEVRLSAARKLNDLVNHLVSSTSRSSPQQQDNVISRCLSALSMAISSLWSSQGTTSALNCSLEIHLMELETLVPMLEKRGENILTGWDTVFSIIISIFEKTGGPAIGDDKRTPQMVESNPRSPKLVRSSFASLQLICSDFLTTVPDRCFLILIDTLYHFCSQALDLNISLTVSRSILLKHCSKFH